MLAVNRVCVIGGGAAGLSALHHLQQAGLDAQLLERGPHIGGVWRAAEDSAVYDSLVTNLPKEIMEYSRDYPFENVSKSFLHHTDMHQYLKDFTEKNSLHSRIRLSCHVEAVVKTTNGGPTRSAWEVRFNDNRLNRSEVLTCDAVVVCNGHFNVPSVPTVVGLPHFRGEAIHSQQYKNPRAYAGRSVLIIGSKSSGTDISRELIGAAGHVFVSDRNYEEESTYRDGVSYHSAVRYINEAGGVVMNGGEVIRPDVIIFCTGYEYDFPFLHSLINPAEELCTDAAAQDRGGLREPVRKFQVGDRYVRPLYRHVFYTRDPTLSFVGLPHTIIPFPIFHLQSAWVAAAYARSPGSAALPSSDDMDADRRAYEALIERSTAGGGFPRNYHFMGGSQFDYMLFLAGEIGMLSDPVLKAEFKIWLKMVQDIYEDVGSSRPKTVGGKDTYRKRTYEIISPSTGDWRVFDTEM